MIRILGKNLEMTPFLYMKFYYHFFSLSCFYLCWPNSFLFLFPKLLTLFVDSNVIVMIFCLNRLSQRKMPFIHSIFVSLAFLIFHGRMNWRTVPKCLCALGTISDHLLWIPPGRRTFCSGRMKLNCQNANCVIISAAFFSLFLSLISQRWYSKWKMIQINWMTNCSFQRIKKKMWHIQRENPILKGSFLNVTEY